MKIKEGYTIIGGNNHSISTQGPRGGLFIAIRSDEFANSMSDLFYNIT